MQSQGATVDVQTTALCIGECHSRIPRSVSWYCSPGYCALIKDPGDGGVLATLIGRSDQDTACSHAVTISSDVNPAAVIQALQLTAGAMQEELSSTTKYRYDSGTTASGAIYYKDNQGFTHIFTMNTGDSSVHVRYEQDGKIYHYQLTSSDDLSTAESVRRLYKDHLQEKCFVGGVQYGSIPKYPCGAPYKIEGNAPLYEGGELLKRMILNLKDAFYSAGELSYAEVADQTERAERDLLSTDETTRKKAEDYLSLMLSARVSRELAIARDWGGATGAVSHDVDIRHFILPPDISKIQIVAATDGVAKDDADAFNRQLQTTHLDVSLEDFVRATVTFKQGQPDDKTMVVRNVNVYGESRGLWVFDGHGKRSEEMADFAAMHIGSVFQEKLVDVLAHPDQITSTARQTPVRVLSGGTVIVSAAEAPAEVLASVLSQTQATPAAAPSAAPVTLAEAALQAPAKDDGLRHRGDAPTTAPAAPEDRTPLLKAKGTPKKSNPRPFWKNWKFWLSVGIAAAAVTALAATVLVTGGIGAIALGALVATGGFAVAAATVTAVGAHVGAVAAAGSIVSGATASSALPAAASAVPSAGVSASLVPVASTGSIMSAMPTVGGSASLVTSAVTAAAAPVTSAVTTDQLLVAASAVVAVPVLATAAAATLAKEKTGDPMPQEEESFPRPIR